MQEFISREKKIFRMQFGKHLASGLSGYLAGVISASILWALAWYIVQLG
jgi:hypothetical protein